MKCCDVVLEPDDKKTGTDRKKKTEGSATRYSSAEYQQRAGEVWVLKMVLYSSKYKGAHIYFFRF